jgi:replication factor C subunit 3/5
LLTVAAHSFLSQSVFRVEKYRPDTLDDVVSHKDITGTSESSSRKLQVQLYRPIADPLSHGAVVENFIKKGRLPHLLFYGPPGTLAQRIHLETLSSSCP